MRRAAIILLCGLLLSLSWLRSPPTPGGENPAISITAIDFPEKLLAGPQMKLVGAWALRSKGEEFGGYSSLLALDDDRFLAASDRGYQVLFRDPSLGHPSPSTARFAGGNEADKRDVDAESLTRNPQSGQIWAGYEYSNRIVRLDSNLAVTGSVDPPQMHDWPNNSGPEAMVRLDDGRFIVLSEAMDSWWGGSAEGLLFPGDPVEGAAPARFRFTPPDGYAPTDMAQLPDGRVLVLLRRLVFPIPPLFSGRLLLADPALIRPGQDWTGKVVGRLDAPLPTDNYEGLALREGDDGTIIIWLISDDNSAVTQRTLLLKLRWTPPARQRPVQPGDKHKKAREKLARPSE